MSTISISGFRLLLLFLLLMIGAGQMLAGDSSEQPRSYCTKAALAALIAVPKLEYKCGANEEESLNSYERNDAIRDYLDDLRSLFVKQSWWNMQADELNACAITNEARELTKDEQDELIYKRDVFGDDRTRLVAVVDPCIHYSYDTLNAFVLQRAGRALEASQVLNAYFSRIDGSIDFYLAAHGAERLAIVETHTSDGMMPPMPYTTFNAFYIDSVTHRAVPKMIFIDDKGLTNAFRYDDYVFDDESLYKQWKAPTLVEKGQLSSGFQVITISNKSITRKAYSWNGKYLDAAGATALGPKLTRKNERQSPKALIDDLGAAYSNRELGRLDAAWHLSPSVTVSIQLEMTEEIEARRTFTSFDQIERWLRRREVNDGFPIREAREFNCRRGTCQADLDGGIDHNHLYLKTIKYRYVGRRLYLTSILLWEG